MKKKLFKITGITLLTIIILMIVLPFAFQGKIMNIAKKEINNALTADVNFKKIGLNLFSNFPNLTVNIREISVVGRDSFKGDTLVAIKKLSLAVNLLSLFGSNGIEVRKIEIQHPIANLLIDKDENSNWNIVKPSEKPDTKLKPEETTGTFKLAIKNLSLKKGKIVYDDKKGKIKFVATDLNFNMSGNFSADFEVLKAKLSIQKSTLWVGKIPYLSNAKIVFNGDIEADLKNNKYSFKKNILKINALELGLNGWLTMLNEDMDMDLSLKLVKADFKHFLSLIPSLYANSFADIQAEGKLAFAATAKGKMTKTDYPAFQAKLEIEDAKFKYPALPKAVSNIQLLTQIHSKGGILDNTVLEIPKFHAEMGGNPIDVTLKLIKPITNPTFDFGAKGILNLTAVKEFYPLDKSTQLAGIIKADLSAKGDLKTIESQHYENVSIAGLIEFTEGKLKTDMMQEEVWVELLQLKFSQRYANMSTNVKIGKNDLKANGKLENFIAYILKDDVVKGELNLSSNYLNINDLMNDDTPEDAKKKPAAAEAEAQPLSVIEIPENIDFKLNVDIKQLLYDNFDLRNVSGAITVHHQILGIKNLSMKTFGGDMKLTGTYKVQNPARPEVDMNINVNEVDVQQTAKTFTTVSKLLPIIEKANGRISMHFDMKTLLDQTMTPDYNTLNAKGNIASQGVTLGGMEVLNKIADAVKMDRLKKVTLAPCNFSFKCENGRVTTSPFEIKAGKISATVFGTTGLDETIDYTIHSKIPRSELGAEANGVMTNLANKIGGAGIQVSLPEIIELPIGVGGTFAKPVIKLGALGGAGKEVVKEVVEQVVEQGKEVVNEQIEKAIEEAKKQRDKLITEATNQKAAMVKQARDAGNLLVAEADKQGQELIKKAGNNPIAKRTAEESAKKLKQEAKKKSDNLVNEAEKKGDALIAQAKKQGDDLVKQAEGKKV